MAHVFVRIPGSALATLPASHVATSIEFSIGNLVSGLPPDHDYSVCGFTEWSSRWGDAGVFIGWDWGVLRDAIVVLKPSRIRSNLLLIAKDGSTQAAALTNIHLLEWIESLPWREVVSQRALRQM